MDENALKIENDRLRQEIKQLKAQMQDLREENEQIRQTHFSEDTVKMLLEDTCTIKHTCKYTMKT